MKEKPMDNLKPMMCRDCEFYISLRQLCRRHPAFLSKRRAEVACGEFAPNENQKPKGDKKS
jgi:hypothetical protein